MNLPFTGLRAGASIKFISRKSLEEIYTATDIASDDFEDKVEDDVNSGSGVSIDLGAHAGQREDRRYIGQITIGW
ncbi:hypothetical protein ACFL2E_09375 [Thermodesulfobacteriota bacterium]